MERGEEVQYLAGHVDRNRVHRGRTGDMRNICGNIVHSSLPPPSQAPSAPGGQPRRRGWSRRCQPRRRGWSRRCRCRRRSTDLVGALVFSPSDIW
ncbi:uncharacterized protein M6B38_196130 [Iris pallida]|uniref:Uncharacterized protein n=1 Tax=Iris pallida TaxID=29817 RepID=A0AAX6ECU9_IRIPA|nr:uncharacterized protein M6B38_196130 [Iris pallida]